MKPDPRSIRWLYAELPEWVRQGLISPDGAEALRAYYGTVPAQRRLSLVIFAVLGSLLIAGGIILLFAFNWENLSRPIRALLAIAPLVVCQGLGAYTLFRKPDSSPWREGVASGTVIALAAAIGLIGQTYNAGGDLGDFTLVWALLSLPVIYVYQSAMAFALYQFIVIGWLTYERTSGVTPQFYWLMLAGSLPFLWMVWRDESRRTTLLALQWVLVFTITAALGLALDYAMPGLWLIIYTTWLSLLFMIESEGAAKWRERPFNFIGGMGIAALALSLTYEFAWKELIQDAAFSWQPTSWRGALDLVITMIILCATGALWSRRLRERNLATLLWGSAFLVFTCGYMITVTTGTMAAQLLANAYVLVLALTTLWHGLKHAEMGTVNKGLALFSVLILLRFFDSGLGSVGRGLAFIIIGAGFLCVNIVLSRRFKKEENTP